MIKEAIVKIVNKEDLTYDEAYTVMNEIMSGETTPTQNAAFLASLSTKSARAETTDEIAGCAAAMRDHATKVETGFPIFEIVGTGGDNAGSFNISTTSALVAAAGGMKVAKHGNRAASSLCGTADCLEALGVNIDQSPEKCKELLEKVGMCFFFAQKYHSSMKYVGAIRRELGFRTVFNILGPLTNPGSPSMQLLGVYDDFSRFADYLFLCGLILMNNALFDEAIAEFENASKKDRCNVEGVNSYLAFYNCGVIKEVLGDRSAAISYYEKCGDYPPAKDAIERCG